MTPDQISELAFGGTAAALVAVWVCCARAGDKDAATTRHVLAWSAGQRAQQGEEGGTPPGGREPAPTPVPAPPVRLAPVIDLHTRRAA
ncbi:hypothetical protein ACFW1A_10050 [Kitasatospora sp. NPDC058965]|uniref:hypothetical protein n=1 Tax=Kitasatospora sp. NPDC058965 TaxID=3346682 RepID=UPI0036BB095E